MRKALRNNLIISVGFAIIGSYFLYKYKIEEEYSIEGKDVEVIVLEKSTRVLKGIKYDLKVQRQNCVSHLEVTKPLFEHVMPGDKVIVRGINNSCNFYEIKPLDTVNRTFAMCIFILAGLFLFDIFFKFLPESWVS